MSIRWSILTFERTSKDIVRFRYEENLQERAKMNEIIEILSPSNSCNIVQRLVKIPNPIDEEDKKTIVHRIRAKLMFAII